MYPFYFQFIAMEEPYDIGTVPDNDKCRCQDTKYHDFKRFMEKVHRHRHQNSRHDRTERNDAREGHDNAPDSKNDERFPGSQIQNDPQAGGHAFPAFEFHKQGTGMTQNRQQSAANHT